MTYDIVYQPTISYINLRYRISWPTISYIHLTSHATVISPIVARESNQCLQICHQLLWKEVGLWDSRRARKSRICGAHERGDVCGRGNPVWMHVLKLGKVVDEIAEHFVEKRVRRGSTVRQALHVMKDAAWPSTQELHIVYDIVCDLLYLEIS